MPAVFGNMPQPEVIAPDCLQYPAKAIAWNIVFPAERTAFIMVKMIGLNRGDIFRQVDDYPGNSESDIQDRIVLNLVC